VHKALHWKRAWSSPNRAPSHVARTKRLASALRPDPGLRLLPARGRGQTRLELEVQEPVNGPLQAAERGRGQAARAQRAHQRQAAAVARAAPVLRARALPDLGGDLPLPARESVRLPS